MSSSTVFLGRSERLRKTAHLVKRAPSRAWSDLGRGEMTLLPVIVSLVLIGAFFTIQEPAFLTSRNLSNLLIQMTVTGTLAIGVVLVLLLGEIDLSVGSVMGMCAAALGTSLVVHHVPWWAALMVGIVVGVLSGALQGLWISLGAVPSFVVTLAGFLAFYGVQQRLLGTEGTINVFDPTVISFTSSYLTPVVSWTLAVALVLAYAVSAVRTARSGSPAKARSAYLKAAAIAVATFGAVVVLDRFLGVPYAIVIFLVLLVIFDMLMTRTQFGRHVYAMGGDAEATRRAGIKLTQTRVAVFALAGLLAALAGAIAVSRNQAAGTLTGGGTQMLEAIAAAVIGGTSLFGGRGTVWAALFGALVIGTVSNGIDLMGLSSDIKSITQGIILLLAVTLDALARKSNPIS